MNILIVEDSQPKAASIVAALTRAGAVDSRIAVVPDSREAKNHLKTGMVNLLILDLQIPKRFDKSPNASGGAELLRWMARRGDVIEVEHILALSAYELTEEMSGILAPFGVPFVRYEHSSERWRDFLSAYVARVMKFSSDSVGERRRLTQTLKCEAVVLTTVDVELESACRVFNCTAAPEIRDGESWYHGNVGDMGVPVVVGQCTQMGMPSAATLTAKAFYTWSPGLLLMTGICAGIRGRVELGDLIVPDPAWDYGSGKLTAHGILHPDPRPIPLGNAMRPLIRSLQRSPMLQVWHEGWLADKPRSIPRLHLEPAASGSAVIQDEAVTQGISSQIRKCVAVDMENYGFYLAATNLGERPIDFASVKVVVDFADSAKNDSFQRYGAELSCQFSAALIQAWHRERTNG